MFYKSIYFIYISEMVDLFLIFFVYASAFGLNLELKLTISLYHTAPIR